MKNVIVIGDIIIDEYVHGTRVGISAETPTVVASFERRDVFIGGAGLVARHLLNLGDRVDLFSFRERDLSETLRMMMSVSSDPPSDLSKFHDYVLEKEGWTLNRKSRYFVDGYKMVQYDSLNAGVWSADERDEFMIALSSKLSFGVDAVVINDNRHGFFDAIIASRIISLCKFVNESIPIYVDSQISQQKGNHEWYAGCTEMFLNERELREFAGGSSDLHLAMAADMLRCDITLKLGVNGSKRYSRDDGLILHYPGYPVQTVDTCGAGDAYLAAYVSQGDCDFANRWAAISTTYKGTIVPRREDLEKTFSR